MSLTKAQTELLQKVRAIEPIPSPGLPDFTDIDPTSFAAGLAFAASIVDFFTVNSTVKTAEKALSGEFPEEMIAPVPGQIVAISFHGHALRRALDMHMNAARAVAMVHGICDRAKKSAH